MGSRVFGRFLHGSRAYYWHRNTFFGLAGLSCAVTLLNPLEEWMRRDLGDHTRSSHPVVRYVADKYIKTLHYWQNRGDYLVRSSHALYTRYFSYSASEWLTSKINAVNLVTYQFAHGGIVHLTMCVVSLHAVMNIVGLRVSRSAFLVSYLSCGFLGANIDSAIQNNVWLQQKRREFRQRFGGRMPGVRQPLPRSSSELNARELGSSGSVIGALTIASFMLPRAQIGLFFLPVTLKTATLAQMSFDLAAYLGGWNLGLAHTGHLGGNIAGVLLWFLWLRRGRMAPLPMQVRQAAEQMFRMRR